MAENPMTRTINKNVLAWSINRVGFVDSFTGEALDVRSAVMFEGAPKATPDRKKLYVMTGANWDKAKEALEERFILRGIIDGREL
jgi:hypothetical protein